MIDLMMILQFFGLILHKQNKFLIYSSLFFQNKRLINVETSDLNPSVMCTSKSKNN
jgi:hypothetical protein